MNPEPPGRSPLGRLKDAALEKAIVAFLRDKVARYGEIRSFTLDTSLMICSAEILLHGDAVPLAIVEAHYRIEETGADTRLVLYGIKAPREWVQNVLEDYVPEIRFKIPAFVKALLG